MYATLSAAHARLDEVIEALTLDAEISASKEFAAAVRRVGWRRFVYSGAIVNLYGALEQFVDGLIEVVADGVPALYPTFAAVPARLRENHDQQVRQLLASEGRGRFERDEVDRLVLSLASCLGDGRRYRLSAKALSFHDANLRLPEIRSLFQRVDVDLPDPSKDSAIAALFDDVLLEGIYHDMEGLLKDIVDRRNEISHGDYANLLEVDVLVHVVKIIKRFAEFLVEEVRRSIFGSIEKVSVGYVTNYLDRVGVHLVQLDADELRQGDMIFGIERGTRLLCSVEVVGMMDDGTAIDHVIRETMRDSDSTLGLKCSPEHRLAGRIYRLTEGAGAFLRSSHAT